MFILILEAAVLVIHSLQSSLRRKDCRAVEDGVSLR